jgi:hypothetical protein
MTNDTMWRDRAWTEVLTAAGNNTDVPFGTTQNPWNTDHWLDTGEFILAFAYAYDWMYDAWTPDQRNAIMWSMINNGLTRRLASGLWWETANGNWNCVCNGGSILGALAILDADPTGTAAQVLATSIPNAAANCAFAVSDDGTWAETSDYWFVALLLPVAHCTSLTCTHRYFGSTGHAQAASGLLTATGSDQGLLTSNPNFNKTGLFHMYGFGNVQKFDYGDCGPNKFTATANCMMLYGSYFNSASS